jgi:tetraacyldisaccharide 4'-kinase
MSRWLDTLWYGDSAPADRPLARGALRVASVGFGAGVRVRNALYERGLLGAARISGARVVSVGNLNVGGAGKTPSVIFLAEWAKACGKKVAVLSRGYGRGSADVRIVRGDALSSASEVGDEPRLIAARLKDVPVLVGPDRAVLAARAQTELGADFILLDDGMQHRRLARDVDIVVVDAEAGFGNGRVLPYGPLREPLEALERAHLIWLRESDGARPLPLPEEKVVRTRHAATQLVKPGAAPVAATELSGQPVVAFAGIARPDGFFRAVKATGAEVKAERAYADHHTFTAGELHELRSLAMQHGAQLVTTEKDQQRLPDDLTAYVLRVEVRITAGLDRLAGALGLDAARIA